MSIRGRGLGTGPGAALLIGGGGVACGVVSASTGGCLALPSDMMALVMRCSWRETDRDLCRCVWGGWVGKGTQHAAKWLREAHLTRPTEG